MRLRDEFVTQEIDDTQLMVAAGGDAFNGVVRSNKTAAFIVDMLSDDVTREDIVDAMCRKYDAPREVIAADVKRILAALHSIGALDEGEQS